MCPANRLRLGGATVRQVRVNSGGYGKELRIVTYGRSRETRRCVLAGEIKPRGTKLKKKTANPESTKLAGFFAKVPNYQIESAESVCEIIRKSRDMSRTFLTISQNFCNTCSEFSIRQSVSGRVVGPAGARPPTHFGFASGS